MKILFGIQATGNGHITRSIEIYNLLKEMPDMERLDVVISGGNSSVEVPFPVNYTFRGLTFLYGKKGKISFFKSLRKTNWFRFFKDVFSIPFKQYDLIISDFEPITLWGARFRRVTSVGVGNAYSMESKNFPKMGLSSRLTKYGSKLMCPAKSKVGMHFKKFDEFVFNPIIRTEILNAEPTTGDFILVYLISFTDDELLNILNELRFEKYHFVLYSKQAKAERIEENVTIKPINTAAFTRDIIHCGGVITAGGFQTAAEALHLGKKLFVIPIKSQVEQLANAKVLKEMGVTTAKKPDPFLIKHWIENVQPTQVIFESELQKMVNYILSFGKPEPKP
jgi:uncharacterized protein (TIGR00661 family)